MIGAPAAWYSENAPRSMLRGTRNPAVTDADKSIFSINNLNGDASTVELNDSQTRLRFAGGLFDVPLDPASNDLIAGGATTLLQFTPGAVNAPPVPPGDQTVELILDGTENGNDFSQVVSAGGACFSVAK